MQIYPLIDPRIESGTAEGQILWWDDTAKRWRQSETTEMFWDDSGKVFAANILNALDEDNALQIDGSTILRTGASANNNLFLGVDCFSTADGDGNIGIGFEAGKNISPTSANNGDDNVYIGYAAGRGDAGGSTARRNIFIGFAVGLDATSAHHNVALGYAALSAVTEGNGNFALGWGALFNATIGSSNVAIGNNSLFNITNGDLNIAIGREAAKNLSGNEDKNTFIGDRSAMSLTVGASNVFIGYHSGWQQTNISERLIIDNQDRGSVAGEVTDTLIYGVFSATPASQSLRFNIGTTTWHNATHEDSDGGRKSQLNFKGQQSGGEETTLARIEIGHEGTGDDEKGYLDFLTNATSDGNSPTGRFRIGSNGFLRSKTTNYRRYYHLPLASFDPGASGATWTSAGANNLCGWQLNNSAETLEFQSDVHADWDAASDLEVEIKFQLLNAGNPNDTVDLQLICYYMGLGDTATKTQTLEVATTTDGTQFKMYQATFTINHDEGGNVVDVADSICFVLNLETDTSEIDNILIVDGSFNYNTTHIGIESGDT